MISVIIPVYNVEKWLRRCVDSLLAQTYADFEFLLIDDGSTDHSGAICNEYAEKDSRVRVLHKQNGGVSSARNLGLENVRGEWIAFCDADDFVTPYYLENLCKAADTDDVDLVFNYAIVDCNGKAKKESYPEKDVRVNEISELFLQNDLIWHTSTWSKLFKHSIIEKYNLRYIEDVHIGEDALFLFSYILNCRRLKVICTCDYHYIIRNTESLTHRVNSFQSEIKGLRLILEIVERLKSRCRLTPELHNKFDWLTGSYKRRALNALYHDKIGRKERMNFLKATDFSDYIAAINENSLQGRIYKWALANNHNKLYDAMRIAVKKIRPCPILQ
jgi:Glycosyltransferases involved in cell wall biogenesis